MKKIFSKNFLQKLSLLLLVVFLGGCEVTSEVTPPKPDELLQEMLSDKIGVKIDDENNLTMYFVVNRDATSVTLYTSDSTNDLPYTKGGGGAAWGEYEGGNIKLLLFDIYSHVGSFLLWIDGKLIYSDDFMWQEETPTPNEIQFEYESIKYTYSTADKTLDATDVENSFLCAGGVYYGHDNTAFRFFEIGDYSVKVVEAITSFSGDNNLIVTENTKNVVIEEDYDNVVIAEGVNADHLGVTGNKIGNIFVHGSVGGFTVYGGVRVDNIIIYGSNYSDFIIWGSVGNIFVHGSVLAGISYDYISNPKRGSVEGDVFVFGTVGNNIIVPVGGDIYNTTEKIYAYLKDNKEGIDKLIKYSEFNDVDSVEYKYVYK